MCVFQIEPLAFQAAKQRPICQRSPYASSPLPSLSPQTTSKQLPVSQTGCLKIVLLPIQHHRPQSFTLTCFQRL